MHHLWAGFEAARLDVLTAAARGAPCPAVLVFGVHGTEQVLARQLPASVLAYSAIQYLPLSLVMNEKALSDAVTAAITGSLLPMPPEFMRGSSTALLKALTAVTHCLLNVSPQVNLWISIAGEAGTEVLPQPIPAFLRSDQRDTVEQLAVFEPLAQVLTGGKHSLLAIIEHWHGLEKAWQDFQCDAARNPTNQSSPTIMERLLEVQRAIDLVKSRVRQFEQALPDHHEGLSNV